MTAATITTARDAKKAKLRTKDAPAAVAFDVAARPGDKAEFIVGHLGTKTAQVLAAEQLRRGTKVRQINNALAGLRPNVSLETVAAGAYLR